LGVSFKLLSPVYFTSLLQQTVILYYQQRFYFQPETFLWKPWFCEYVFNICERYKWAGRQGGLTVVCIALFPLALVVLTSRVFLARSELQKMSNRTQYNTKETHTHIVL
jgi:hypothetical protein